jgi:hypothetical protein
MFFSPARAAIHRRPHAFESGCVVCNELLTGGIPKPIAIALRVVIFTYLSAFVLIPELPPSFSLAVNPSSHLPYNILRSHGTVTRLDLLWGFIGLRSIPAALRVIIAVLVASLSLAPFPRVPLKPGGIPVTRSRLREILKITGITIAMTGLFYLLRFPYTVTRMFGDGGTIPGDLQSGMLFPAELLNCYYLIAIHQVGTLLAPSFTYLDAGIWGSSLAGGVFTALVWFFSEKWSWTPAERIVLTAGILCAGYSAMFFGYVETTHLELTLLMAFTLCSFFYIAAETRHARWRREIVLLSVLSMALLAHGAGCALIPAALLLAAAGNPEEKGTLFRFNRNVISAKRIIAIVAIILIPYYQFLVEPFFMRGNFGNITGGADGIMFVPFTFDYANPVSPLVSYSMFSFWHLADITSAFVVAAPLSIPIAAVSAWSFYSRRHEYSRRERQFLGVLAVTALASLLVPLTWNHDWGMWGDWNIAAAYLFPLNCFAWVAFIAVHRPIGFSRRDIWGIALPLVLVQALFALGLVVQLT